jgi:hypothetical protein
MFVGDLGGDQHVRPGFNCERMNVSARRALLEDSQFPQQSPNGY